jgi:hypothetical protein
LKDSLWRGADKPDDALGDQVLHANGVMKVRSKKAVPLPSAEINSSSCSI